MTINATGDEDAWQRQCLVEVTSDSTHIVRLTAMTETVDIDMGERGLDVINLINLGQIPKHTPIGLTTVTIEGYPQEAATETTSTGDGFFDLFASSPLITGSQPADVDVSNTLTRYRVAVLWTNDADCDDASDDVDSADKGMRFVMANCFCTSCKTSFTDGILKQTLVFKGTAFGKDGGSTAPGINIKMESCDATAAIAALGNYTAGTTNWA